MPVKTTKCLYCDKLLVQTTGKREKKFCNSNCRASYYQKYMIGGTVIAHKPATKPVPKPKPDPKKPSPKKEPIPKPKEPKVIPLTTVTEKLIIDKPKRESQYLIKRRQLKNQTKTK